MQKHLHFHLLMLIKNNNNNFKKFFIMGFKYVTEANKGISRIDFAHGCNNSILASANEDIMAR